MDNEQLKNIYSLCSVCMANQGNNTLQLICSKFITELYSSSSDEMQ